jgi:hypothetical protein
LRKNIAQKCPIRFVQSDGGRPGGAAARSFDRAVIPLNDFVFVVVVDFASEIVNDKQFDKINGTAQCAHIDIEQVFTDQSDRVFLVVISGASECVNSRFVHFEFLSLFLSVFIIPQVSRFVNSFFQKNMNFL